MDISTSAAERAYRESLSEILEHSERIGEADIVVGIPFQNEVDTIVNVYKTVVKGLSEFFSDEKCVIVCAGAPEGKDALKAIQKVPLVGAIKRIAFLMKGEQLVDKVWSLRAIMETANRLNSDVAVVDAGLKSRKGKDEIEGLAPEWIHRLLFPVKKESVDLVIPRFNNHYLEASASNHLICPLLSSIFNLKVAGLPGLVFGISSKLLRTYLSDADLWNDQAGEYSLDVRLITTASVNKAKICQTSLGLRIQRAYPDKEKMWRQQTRAIFEQILASEAQWQQMGDMIHVPDVFGDRKKHFPEEMTPDPSAIERYRQGFNEFQALYEEILSREAVQSLRRLAGTHVDAFKFPSSLWVEVVYDFLLHHCLEQGIDRESVLNAFIPICYARDAGFNLMLEEFKEGLNISIPREAEHQVEFAAQEFIEQEDDEFIKQKPRFLTKWQEKEDLLKPLLPMVTYREFVPGVPLILPKELTSPGGETISTDAVYNAVLQRFTIEFEEFVEERLKLPRQATSSTIAERIENLMHRVERALGEVLLSGDLSTVDGTREVADVIFQNFPHSKTFALKPEVVSWILQRHLPSNLLIRSGAANLAELEQNYGPNDILALAALSEETEYMVRVWAWIAANVRSENFTHLTIKPLVVSGEDFPMLTVLKEPSTLSKLTGRIVVSNLIEGAGGEFPRLRYFTTMSKNIVEAERFGEIWEQFAHDRKEFGTKVINSLRGHWAGNPLSAHNIFENKNQRILIDRMRQMIAELVTKGDELLSSLTTSLRDVTDCYHLAVSVPGGKFIPCSAWTWASYSFKGGVGVPTPLSLHVERDWATREFLVELLKALGDNEEIIDQRIIQLIGQGMESENLARLVLPGWQSVQEVLPKQRPRPAEPEAGKLRRFTGNPILKAIPDHHWESKYIFNPGVLRLEGKIYILYRACGEDEISHIGLAISSDGLHIDERLDSPIFEPEEEWERKGCEDPRLVLIGERIYMLYTAYSSIAAQIALASIDLKDFLNRRWNKWQRHGLAFPGFDDKDATLFKDTFDGRYVMYHRIEPSIWISSSGQLDCPWPREDHRILMGPGAGMAWDGFKIGGGSEPIKTEYGWLLIYHGVDQSFVYRLGVLLVKLDDPGQLLYRSPNPILEPEEFYEVGGEGYYVPNVVFTCGAIPKVDKEILGEDDEILVYYGAADTVACVATAKVSDLIPEEIRQSESNASY